jgi:hypothetical protein
MRTLTIGRDESCDIVLGHSQVSRFHATLLPEGRGYIYRDKSSNGTRINGTLLKNGEMYVSFGDSVLLGSVMALPWHKVQSMLPVSDAGHYAPPAGAYAPPACNPEAENITYSKGTGLIIAGYICMFGIIGLFCGLTLVNATQMTAQGKVKKYTPSAVTNGWVILSISIISNIIGFIVVANS